MKSKHFKLKILLIFSICLILIGFVGSCNVFTKIKGKIDEEILKKSILDTKEILKTEKELKYLEIIKYVGHNVEVRKSKDNFNHIFVTYNPEYFDYEANLDENGKVQIITKRVSKPENSNLNFVNRIIENAVIQNSSFFFGKIESYDKRKLVLEVKNPIEIMGVVNILNSQRDLIKNELTFSQYDRHLFNTEEFEKTFKYKDEFTIKNVNYPEIIIPDTNLKVLNYSTDELEKLLISNKTTPHCNEKNTVVNIDAQNVKDFVELNLRDLYTDINIKNAKKVILSGVPKKLYDVTVKYKSSEGEKSFTINSKNKGIKNSKIVIKIDSEEIFRTLMNLDLTQKSLEDLTDLQKIK